MGEMEPWHGDFPPLPSLERLGLLRQDPKPGPCQVMICFDSRGSRNNSGVLNLSETFSNRVLDQLGAGVQV
jgi:hypothetical protein